MNSEIYEIAYATASKRLCLFTGTGFSKSITDNKAPGWQSLLESMCNLTTQADELKLNLFPSDGKNPLSLEESAQVVATELSNENKSIHEEIAKQIVKLELSGDTDEIKSFFQKETFDVITTNYDKLINKMIDIPTECHSIVPGLPIPRSNSRVKVYHVHGSVDSPNNMIVTSDDYFKFMNNETYFSRKLSTILHEHTVIIMGYSLGDTNLKAIISDYKNFIVRHNSSSSVFFISRSKVNQYLKDYYAKSFGIRVLDNIETNDFFQSLNKQIPIVEKVVDASISNINKVLIDGQSFTDHYLKINNSFYEIISSLSAIGKSTEDADVIVMIGDIIEKKRVLTTVNSAWEQYTHLAQWLIYLATILDLEDTSIKDYFLQATERSMTTMSQEQYFGYSWSAYKSWDNKWFDIIPSNRAMIKKYIKTVTTDPDAVRICEK